MTIHLTHYVRIKDKYCIAYVGLCREYVVQLLALRPYLERSFPEIELWLAFKDENMDLAEGYDRVISGHDLKERRYDFSCIREIICDMSSHPVETLLSESELEVPCLQGRRANEAKKLCLIAERGHLPTRSLTPAQIERCRSIAASRGMQVTVDPSRLDQCAMVIGVENEWTYKAGLAGIETTFVDTGIGKGLFTMMFPEAKCIKL